MKAFWACRDSHNFGDVLPEWIFQQMGISLEWSDGLNPDGSLIDETHYGFCGSIMSQARSNFIMSGCGFGHWNDVWFEPPKKIFSCRGQMTRERIHELGGECPKKFFDITYLLPAYLKASKVKHKNGFIKHWASKTKTPDGMFSIDITGPIEKVVKQVTSCSFIYSESLHGLILADAYGIPRARIKAKDSHIVMIGGRWNGLSDWKYDDYESGKKFMNKIIAI